jgi:hypothetical protein
MRGDTIEQFMWGFQRIFRHLVEMRLKTSLEMLGVSVEPTVFLVGLLKEGGAGHPLCVEPEDGPIVPANFDRLDDRASELYDQDPESKMLITASWIHERRQQEVKNRATGTAIVEVLEARLGPGLRFFAALPTLVDQHMVFTVVGFPESLVRGAVDEILRLSSRALLDQYAGPDLDLGADPADVVKAAGRALTRSATLLAGNDMEAGLFDGLTRVATTRYERRVGIGSLLLADASSEHVDRSVTLRAPVPITDTRTLRKLLETSSRHGESLLTDGSVAYGLGRQSADYPEASESVFQVLIIGDGVWELHHADIPLATVQFGAPRLPEQRLQRVRLEDIAGRVFQEHDSDALWALATAAADAEHGTMLVISEHAAEEAVRLASQALTIEPTKLDDNFVRQVTGIDGAVLVDPSGCCHAIGVILDGSATEAGDRSRGARYNSAVKYMASARDTPTVILLVSEDGMINLLPDLRPRMRRAELNDMLTELREAAAIEPVNAERFYNAYRRIEAAAFYLSPVQIEEVNALRDGHWERRMAEGANMRVVETPLRPDPKMTDEYLID